MKPKYEVKKAYKKIQFPVLDTKRNSVIRQNARLESANKD